MKVLDSTVAVDHLRGREEARSLLDRLAAAGEAVVASEVVRFEILAGAREAEMGRIEAFFSALGWVAVTEPVTGTAADLARRFAASHTGVGPADYLIAATAVVLEADLLTTNIRHFPMFEGLQPPYP